MLIQIRNILMALTVLLGLAALPVAGANAATATGKSGDTYTAEEIVSKGHRVFGRTTKEVASVVEYAFQRNGEPNGYIVGEEGSGAIIGGLRYGEGTLFMKNGFRKKVYWQGPSIGMDPSSPRNATCRRLVHSTSGDQTARVSFDRISMCHRKFDRLYK